MRIATEPYVRQLERWPKTGRHILACYEDETVVVYQAYRPSIGHFAARHGYFGGEFSLGRMSWIKPSFLWMMYRSGWGTKPDQEVVLAVVLRRSAFDTILASAVHASYVPGLYAGEPEWKKAVEHSSVRLQWDPDRDPSGARLERRAIQLGLRGDVLAQYAMEWIERIDDISRFVNEQYTHVLARNYDSLIVPLERPYPIAKADVAERLGISI